MVWMSFKSIENYDIHAISFGESDDMQLRVNLYNELCLSLWPITKPRTLAGNSTSKKPSLQNVSLKLAEILQAYSITKSCDIVQNFRPKEWNWRPLWIFQVFFVFRFVYGSFV